MLDFGDHHHDRSCVRLAARVDMHYTVQVGDTLRRVELPFVTAVLADLRGKPADPREPIAERGLVDVDEERFDDFVASLAPRLAFRVPNLLTGDGELSVDLTFRRMRDFEPATWMRQVEPMRALIDACVTADPQVANELGRRLDEQASRIVHHAEFTRLEATWRGLHRLVMRSECDDTLKIRVLELSKEELAKVLLRYRGTSWDQSPIFKRLYAEGLGSSGGEPVGCIVLDFAFDHRPADVVTLRELAKIASASHAPLLAAAAPSLMQMDGWYELPNPRDLGKIFTMPEYAGWRELRDSEDSRYLVLTLPRYLARAPYGGSESGGTTSALRETEVSTHHLVWCHAAYLLAENLHRAFKVHGWCAPIAGPLGGAVEGLPRLTLHSDAGLPQPVCATEVAINDRRLTELVKAGLTPIVARADEGWAAFDRLATLNRPAEYDDPDATHNARMAANLVALFSVCRVAHFLKAIGRDVLQHLGDTRAAEDWLRSWIANYVDRPQVPPGGMTDDARPFASADVEVRASDDDPTLFTTRYTLRPAAWVMGRDAALPRDPPR